jgi:hypothetical protein
MVLSQGMSQGGNSTLSVEFDSQTKCIAAMAKMKNDLASEYIKIYSANCFEK